MLQNKTIGIFAPSAALKEGEEVFLAQGIEILEHNGYKVKLARNIPSKKELFDNAEYFVAGSHDERLNSFHEIYQDPDVDIVLGLRGGYGSIYLVPEINYEMIARNPKPIFGYSDLTAIFLALIKKTKIKCFHSPMLLELSRLNTESLDSFFNMLSICENHISSERKILGGNLSLISALVGTEYLPDFKDATLFIEDCNEEPYKIDRLLNHLRLAGIFEQVKEIWLGEPFGTEFNIALLEKIAEDLEIKLVTGVKVGHCETKLTIALG